jgi:hypothetical protein
MKQITELPTRIGYLTYIDFADNDMETLAWEKLFRAFNKIQRTPVARMLEKKAQSPEVIAGIGLSNSTLKELRDFLLQCDEVGSDSRLKTLFVGKDLSIFRISLPEAKAFLNVLTC